MGGRGAGRLLTRVSQCVWSSNDSVATRVDAIDVLVDAAFQLSSLHKMPEPPQMEEEGDTLPSLGKTRRWSNKSKIKRPRPQENQFGKHAKAFFFGMLSGWNEETSQRLLHVDMYILGRMISSLGVFIECCGNSPATPMLASGLLDLTSHASLRQHREVGPESSLTLPRAEKPAGLHPPLRLLRSRAHAHDDTRRALHASVC